MHIFTEQVRQLSDKGSSFDRVFTGEGDVTRLDENSKPKLPLRWKIAIVTLTCCCTFGNNWSSSLIVALKTTIIQNLKIDNSEFATLVAVTNLVNTFLCIAIGFCIDKWGGPLWTTILAVFHLSGAVVMSGSATNHLNSYPLLILGQVLAAIGDSSIDNAQHRIFSTYFAPGRGFAFSIGAIWCVANLAQFTGQSTANVISRNLGTYAWSLWISSVISVFSLLCAVAVFFLDRFLRARYNVTDQTTGRRYTGAAKSGVFKLKAITQFPLTFWIVVLFTIFETAGVQSFLSISTQLAQQRLKTGAVVGGWVSSFYLLLPACLTPLVGIFVDFHGHRVTLLFISGATFLISMLLLKFSHSVPTFIAAYVFYSLSQTVTSAPQVEIIRNIIPDPQFFASGFAIKKSAVQASQVIITTAAGKIQDDAHNSLDPTITLWLVYGFLSVFVSGSLLFLTYIPFGKKLLPGARLSQVRPRKLKSEVERLYAALHLDDISRSIGKDSTAMPLNLKEKEKILKSPSSTRSPVVTWIFPLAALGVIFMGCIMFGLSVEWGAKK